MNFIFISPNVPARYYQWVEALNERGINVYCIVDCSYNELDERLIAAAKEIYYVRDMNDFDAMVEAVAYFEAKYGKIDYLESMNEWWLRSDAKLRAHFGIPGLLPEDMERITAKSGMKSFFEKGGAKTIRYMLVNGPEDKEKALSFLGEVGFPLFVKPNVGVGAADSYALHNQEDFDAFFRRELAEPYIMEEYIDGIIVSFDGICDEASNVVFATTDHFPEPIADTVIKQDDYYYFNNPFSLPMRDLNDAAEFERVGRAVVKAFGIKKRFFHIEFFVLKEEKKGLGKRGDFIALECNMRAPGGDCPDLIDYGNSCSVFDIYADVIAYNENRQDMNKTPYYAFASNRRDGIKYQHSLEEVLVAYQKQITQWGRYPKALASAMCDVYIDAVFSTFEEGLEFDSFVREKANVDTFLATK